MIKYGLALATAAVLFLHRRRAGPDTISLDE